jgi:DNA-binding MarR family transcriptional regulator
MKRTASRAKPAEDEDAGPAGEGPALELGRFLPYRLHVTAEQVSQLFSKTYERRFGIGIPEWRVLAQLGENPAMPTQAVIERTGMDPVKVSRAVTRLVDKGLAMRRAHPTDQRSQVLGLTRRGLAMYREIVPPALALEAELTGALTPAEQAALDGILTKLLDRARSLAPATED